MATHLDEVRSTIPRSRWGGPAVCLASAALAAATFPMIGNSLRPVDGVATTTLFADAAGRLEATALLGSFAAAGLFLAAVRLSRVIPGGRGVVTGIAGGAVALMLAVYTSAFAAGSTVAARMLDDPGPGVGEAALVAVNMADFARLAPSLALAVAVALSRRHLPKPITVSAAVLAFLFLTPVTAWIGAVLAPVWLGIAGALAKADGHPKQ